MSTNEIYSISTYNIGFGAYTHDFSFFMDSGETLDGEKVTGKDSVAKDKDTVISNTTGAVDTIVDKNVDCKEKEDNYRLRLRLATFTSSMGIYGSELVPWHCFPVFFAGIATAVYPLRSFTPMDIISNNYMSFIVVGSILILTFTGFDRFIPMFRLPDDERIPLKRMKES